MKFCEIPWTSVFRFFAEKIKFREIPWTSVFRFFAEFRILFRIPFLRGKKLNSAEFCGIPYSVISVFRFYAKKIKFRGILRNSVFRYFRIPCSIFILYFSAEFRKKYETGPTEFR